jgi:hypothetical protein
LRFRGAPTSGFRGRTKESKNMDKPKRSYYLPGKLVDAFDKECLRAGFVKEKVVAAAIYTFMESGPEVRSKMFDDLDAFLRGKKK